MYAIAADSSDPTAVRSRERVEGQSLPDRASAPGDPIGGAISGASRRLRAFAALSEPFWRGDPSARHSAGSTGLGLSMARQLARLLGGDLIVARSAVGQGSTFVAALPVRYPGTSDGDTDGATASSHGEAR